MLWKNLVYNNSPSNHAIIGRYILPKKIFKILQNQKPSQNGEIHITDAIKTLINKKEKFIGHIFFWKIFRLWNYERLY